MALKCGIFLGGEKAHAARHLLLRCELVRDDNPELVIAKKRSD